jgi:hypothetical protein
MPPTFWVAMGTAMLGEDGEVLSGVTDMDAEARRNFGGGEGTLAGQDVGGVVPGGRTPARESAGVLIPDDDVLAAYTPACKGTYPSEFPVGKGVLEAALVTADECRCLGCRKEVISKVTE